MDALRKQAARPLTAGDLANIPDFCLGELTVSPSRRKITGPSGTADLQPRVMQVLVLLAQSAGQVVSRETLLDRCWGGVYVGDDSLNRVVGALRKLVIDTADDSFAIETIPRVGYRLVARGGQQALRETRPRPDRRLLAALAVIVAATIAITGIRYAHTGGGPQQPNIAVLPFTPLNPGRESADFGQSIAATVGNALAQTGAHLPDNVRTVDDARSAGAALIVSGTVRREGSTFTVVARVASARDGATILTNEFQADADHAPELPRRVASWMTSPVRMWSSFLPVESDPGTTDEILRIFLTRQTGDGLRAWELSRSLAASRPSSGAAQLVTALLTSDVLALIAPEQRRSAIAAARRSATSAAHLLPDPARPLAVLDCHLTAPGWQILTPKCDQRTRAAISANPDVPLLPFLFAIQLVDTGRFVEAVKFADMDLAQSPLGAGQLSLRIFATRMTRSGDSDAMLPQLEDRIRRYVGPGSLAYFDYSVAVANGDMRAAEVVLGSSGDAIAAGETKETMETVLRAVRSKSPPDVAAMRERCDPPSSVAAPEDPAFGTCIVGFTLLGDPDRAFAAAVRGYRDVACCSPAQQQEQWLASGGEYRSRSELFGRAMAPFRADPRFVEIARRTGLLAYWKSGHPPDFCSVERAPVCRLLGARPSSS